MKAEYKPFVDELIELCIKEDIGDGDHGHPAVADPQAREHPEGEHTQDRPVGIAGNLVDEVDDAVVGQVLEAEDHQRHADGHADVYALPDAGQAFVTVAPGALQDVDRERGRKGRKGRTGS